MLRYYPHSPILLSRCRTPIRSPDPSSSTHPEQTLAQQEREKLILLFVGLGLEGWFKLAGAITWSIALIAIISHVTFIQRLVYTRRELLAVSMVQKDSEPKQAED